jgi:hypothetical protein
MYEFNYHKAGSGGCGGDAVQAPEARPLAEAER